MNILFDHQIFQAQRYGGISRYFHELISRIAGQPGVETSLFMGLHINRYGTESARKACRAFLGWRRVDIPRTYRLFAPVNRTLLEAFSLRSRADVYHPTYYASYLPVFRGLRVLTVFDMIHELFPAEFPLRDRTSELKRRAVSRADRLIAISESTRQDLIRLLEVPPERVRVIHLANSLVAEPGARSPVDGPYFLHVAGRAGYKNFELSLRALASPRLRRSGFKLAAFGAGPFTRGEKAQINALGLEGRVLHFEGDDPLLATLYRHASAFLYPSLYEGFGLPPLESMRYGCPVVASRVSSIPEVCGDAAEYFEPGSVDSCVAAVEKVLDDAELRALLARRGQARERQYSWDRVARETLAYYRD